VVCVLIMTVAGLVASMPRRPSSQTVATTVEGSFEVSYDLVTLETPTTTQSSGGQVEAIRIDYFPSYVLVTSTNNTTFLWRIDRLRTFEVRERSPSDADQ
jgi:hypothetical protein